MATKLAETKVAESQAAEATPRTRATSQAEWISALLRRKWLAPTTSIAGDALAITAAHISAKAAAIWMFQVPALALNPRDYAAFYLPFLLGVLFVFERNQRPELRRPEKELELVVKGVSLGFALLVCANFVVFKSGFSRYMIVVWYLLTLVYLLAVRFGLRLTYGAFWRRGIGQKKTLLVGSAQTLFELQTLLTIQRYRGYEILGIVPSGDDPPESFESRALPILGRIDRWHEAIRKNHVEQVIVALDENALESDGLASDILSRCLADGVDVQIYSDLFASREFNYELDEFSGFFRFFATPRWSKSVQLFAKLALDLAAGIVGSMIALVTLPLIVLFIKLEDGGPIFYRSAYVGPDGGNRYYLKFRTMRVDADKILERDPELRKQFEAQCKLKKDPRVTRIGRFLRKYSVDEFPSFFSIFLGHISLVGPRTIMQMQKEKYGPTLPKLLSVKPGLTGFWQVMGRQLTTHEERVEMDMFYIDHWSIWLDLWIVAKTLVKVVKAEGAY